MVTQLSAGDLSVNLAPVVVTTHYTPLLIDTHLHTTITRPTSTSQPQVLLRAEEKLLLCMSKAQ